MEDNIGLYYVLDNEMKPSEELADLYTGKAVYEVIRIIDRVPLFMEEHYERMEKSTNLQGLKMTMEKEALENIIKELVGANNLENCNVKVIVFEGMGVQNCLAYISRSYYPSGDEVERGVTVGLLKLERKNPNAKVVNTAYKEAVGKKIKDENVFEVLLVNDSGFITEGSRSNVFFVNDKKIFTAPGDVVLKGITRQYVLDACKNCGIEVVESLTGVNELDDIEGLFLSGTSIKVLPVSMVEGFTFKSGSHPVIVSVRDEFDRILERYIREHK